MGGHRFWLLPFPKKRTGLPSRIFSTKNTNIDRAFIMWPVYGRLRLSFAVAILTVPPIPSHALLPWDVAKCHSHVMPKSVACARCWWNWTSFCIAPRSRPKNNVFCSTPLSVSAFQEWGVSKIHVPYWHCVMLHQKQSRDFGDTPRCFHAIILQTEVWYIEQHPSGCPGSSLHLGQ